ncbi:hypothetical protein [Streptomyces sp. NPDC059786]|uniref:hypothetical protein n=1 Tax=Streptomyces sp. NPDC059786 TaxID=3346946 RepID=UPI00366532DC
MGWVDREHAPKVAADYRYARLINLTRRVWERGQLRARLAADLRQVVERGGR